MDFDLTDEQKMIRDTARDFAARKVAPVAAELDKSGRWPGEIVSEMAKLGLLGIMVPRSTAARGWTPSRTPLRWKK